MTIARLCGVMAAALIGAIPSSAAAPDVLARLFRSEAAIEVDGTGLARLVVPPAVLAACRPDLSDLRVFDDQGREVAYLVDADRGRKTSIVALERFEPEILSVKREEAHPENEPPLHREIYEISLPPSPPETSVSDEWMLAIEASTPQFVRELTISSVTPQGIQLIIIEGASLFVLDENTHRTRVSIPQVAAKSLTVTLAGREGSFLEPRFHFESAREIGPLHRAVVPLEVESVTQKEGTTHVDLQRPSGIVPDLLEIDSATASFRRRVKVWDVRPGSADRVVGLGTLYRVATRQGVDERDISLSQARGASLRIEIEDGDSPPLAALDVRAIVDQPILLFELPSGAGVLRFGGGRAYRPRYDLSGLLPGARRAMSGDPARAAARLYEPEQLAQASLGPIGPNPSFDASPALAFAMHPGAEIDLRLFEVQRPIEIEPSAEGLSSLQLAPDDVAAARADLADVRIVDSDAQQWPYLVENRATSHRVTLDIGERRSEDRTSVYHFDLPVAPLPLAELGFDVDARYFDRPYRLVALDEEEEERVLASGRLVKDARNPKASRIAFSPTRVHALDLHVEDGDDAPLRLLAATGGLRIPELFLVAPAGTYTLLLGNPEATAPRYELERVRNVVLAVESAPAQTRPLEPNPRFRIRSRLDADSPLLQRIVVWGVILLAAVVLGVMTLRIARDASGQSGEPADPPPGE